MLFSGFVWPDPGMTGQIQKGLGRTRIVKSVVLQIESILVLVVFFETMFGMFSEGNKHNYSNDNWSNCTSLIITVSERVVINH